MVGLELEFNLANKTWVFPKLYTSLVALIYHIRGLGLKFFSIITIDNN